MAPAWVAMGLSVYRGGNVDATSKTACPYIRGPLACDHVPPQGYETHEALCERPECEMAVFFGAQLPGRLDEALAIGIHHQLEAVSHP